MQKLTVYTKSNCHLCEQAYDMLVDLAYDIPLEIELVDIGQPRHKILSDKYNELIPVLVKPGAATQLVWPFTPDDIKSYLIP